MIGLCYVCVLSILVLVLVLVFGLGVGLSRLGLWSWARSWSSSWSGMIKRPSCPSFLRAKDHGKTACQVRLERQRGGKGVYWIRPETCTRQDLTHIVLVLFYLVLSRLVLSRLVSSFRSCPVLPCFSCLGFLVFPWTRRDDLTHFVLSCLVSSHLFALLTLSCLVLYLSCLVLSWSCLVLFYRGERDQKAERPKRGTGQQIPTEDRRTKEYS